MWEVITVVKLNKGCVSLLFVCLFGFFSLKIFKFFVFVFVFFIHILSLISFFNFHSEQVTHFALAFEVPGGWHKEKDAMTLTVLQVFCHCI